MKLTERLHIDSTNFSGAKGGDKMRAVHSESVGTRGGGEE